MRNIAESVFRNAANERGLPAFEGCAAAGASARLGAFVPATTCFPLARSFATPNALAFLLFAGIGWQFVDFNAHSSTSSTLIKKSTA